MKHRFSEAILPNDSILITCSSHEPRCKGLTNALRDWRPAAVVMFHYDDENETREHHHREMTAKLKGVRIPLFEMKFTERDAVRSLHSNMGQLRAAVDSNLDGPVVLDISVFTKRHLLMMLRWLDDAGYWERLFVVYTEPEEYDVTEFVPLSFGLRSIQQVPGFSAAPDLSRPVHLVLFLGYEGDRSLAVYEQVQPMQTTLVLTDPPFRPDWEGRSQELNRNLLALVGSESLLKVDGIDPECTVGVLQKVFASNAPRGVFAKIVCPTGTKPQTLGIYSYIRTAEDCPAIVYASPLRHNHTFFSHGIGRTWLLKKPL